MRAKRLTFVITLIIFFLASISWTSAQTIEKVGSKVSSNASKTQTNQSRIQGLEADLAAETAAREAADTQLQNNIDAETAARQSADQNLILKSDFLSSINVFIERSCAQGGLS